MKNPRIVGALFVGIVLVSGALLMRGDTSAAPFAAATVIATTPRTALPTTDTDKDGLADWEEDLYGTNPHKADMPEENTAMEHASDASPSTVTGQFARDFFGKYFEQYTTGGMDQETQTQLIADAAAYANARVSDQPFTARDLVNGSAQDAATIRTYGNSVASALVAHTVSGENEIAILERALQSDSESDLAALDPILDSYNKTISDLLFIEVPPPFVDEHLALINNILTLHHNIAAMRRSFEDALPAMVRFQRHPQDILQMRETLVQMSGKLAQFGATYGENEPGNLWNVFAH